MAAAQSLELARDLRHGEVALHAHILSEPPPPPPPPPPKSPLSKYGKSSILILTKSIGGLVDVTPPSDSIVVGSKYTNI